MSLKQQLQESLAQLGAFDSGEHAVAVTHGTQQLECHLVALDRLACAFARLSLRDAALAGQSIDGLKAIAQRLSARLTYLLEPISPIETDAQGCVVQMRSNPPHKESDRTSYYELLVGRDGQISLCRFTRTPGQLRQAIPAEVTREVLARLADDFSAAVS